MRAVNPLVAVALAGCTASPSVTLENAKVISNVTTAGAAPMIALSPNGARSVAWIAAPSAGTDGRLFVSTDGAPASELRDTLGGIEPHGESPPKLSYGPDGTLYALYAVARLEAGRRFPFTTLRMAASTDGGRTWDTPRTVTGDSIPRSRNFHALHAAEDGSVYVAWLEARGDSGSRTYLTRSQDRGATWSPAVRAEGESCPCCRVAIATGQGGRMYLAWRAVLAGNVRDIVVATSNDYGATWGAPVRVHDDGWVFEGCPHAGPSILVDARGTLHVGWWTGREGSAGAFYAKSVDGGRTFSPRVPLGEAKFSLPSHVQLAMDAKGTIVAAWDDGRDTLPKVLLRVSYDGGATFRPEVQVGESGAATSFPVVALRNGQLTVAWSERTAQAHSHAEHSMPDMSKPGSVMPLPEVGEQRVLVRQGKIN